MIFISLIFQMFVYALPEEDSFVCEPNVLASDSNIYDTRQ